MQSMIICCVTLKFLWSKIKKTSIHERNYNMQMNKAILRNSETVIFDKKIISRSPGWVFFPNPLDRKKFFFSRRPHELVKNTKTWISWERNITFLRNKTNLNFKWHILRSYRFVAEVTYKAFVLSEMLVGITKSAFTYSKSITETSEQCAKFLHS